MIKDLKNMAAGTQVKGFPLLIKTARKSFTDGEGITWQEVVFMDASGEMLGHVMLGEGSEPEGHHAGPAIFTLWKSKERMCILCGEIQYSDERRKEAMKLIVTECFDTAVHLTHDQIQDIQEENWKRLREEEIKGKIRHGIICAMISRNPTDANIELVPNERCKQDIKELVDFIMTGE